MRSSQGTARCLATTPSSQITFKSAFEVWGDQRVVQVEVGKLSAPSFKKLCIPVFSIARKFALNSWIVVFWSHFKIFSLPCTSFWVIKMESMKINLTDTFSPSGLSGEIYSHRKAEWGRCCGHGTHLLGPSWLRTWQGGVDLNLEWDLGHSTLNPKFSYFVSICESPGLLPVSL